MPRDVKSFCRICTGLCGVTLTLDDNDQITGVRGDKSHEMTMGYACIKGLQAGPAQNGPNRLTKSLKRTPSGSFDEIPLERALDEIADKMGGIIDTYGARAIATYKGTQNALHAVASPMLTAFANAIGTPSIYSTMTIDQSAKWVTLERLGRWNAGKHQFSTADVLMFFGTNPLVSILGINSFPALNPTKRIKDAKERGLKIIMVDPRRTETAQYADLFIQPFPGHDAAIAAAIIRIILNEGWEDKEFCAQNVAHMDDLRASVQPFTAERVAAEAGIEASQLHGAAAMFARDGRRGTAGSGTGPNMAPGSNLAEHMIEALNVVCGRYLRAGDIVDNPGAMAARPTLYAEAESPQRSFDKGEKSRINGFGKMFGEMMTGTLLDEILVPGEGQLRSLVVAGGNPAGMMPDQRRTEEALRALDLLITIEPFMVETARLAHYVLAPTTQYERPDIPALYYERRFYPAPFAQYSPAHAVPPPGSDVADDWYMLWGICKRLGKQVVFDGVPINMETPPTTEEMIEILCRNAQVPLSEFRKYPSGKEFDVAPLTVLPARPEAGRLDAAPADVVKDLEALAAQTATSPATIDDQTYMLVARRMREVSNGSYRDMPAIQRRFRYNPAWLHPDDLARLGLADGDVIDIISDHDRIQAVVEGDDTVKSKTLTITHGWGNLPSEPRRYEDGGSSVNRLVNSVGNVESINGMPWFTGFPVRVERSAVPADHEAVAV